MYVLMLCKKKGCGLLQRGVMMRDHLDTVQQAFTDPEKRHGFHRNKKASRALRQAK